MPVAVAMLIGSLAVAALAFKFRAAPPDAAARRKPPSPPAAQVGSTAGSNARGSDAHGSSVPRFVGIRGQLARRSGPAPTPPPAALSADELAHRIGVADAPPRIAQPDRVPAPTGVRTVPIDQAHPVAKPLAGGAATRPSIAVVPGASRFTRERLIRDTAIAILVLGVAGLVLTGLSCTGTGPATLRSPGGRPPSDGDGGLDNERFPVGRGGHPGSDGQADEEADQEAHDQAPEGDPTADRPPDSRPDAGSDACANAEADARSRRPSPRRSPRRPRRRRSRRSTASSQAACRPGYDDLHGADHQRHDLRLEL